MHQQVFTSKLMTLDEVEQLFEQAHEMKRYDMEDGIMPKATVIDYLKWTAERLSDDHAR